MVSTTATSLGRAATLVVAVLACSCTNSGKVFSLAQGADAGPGSQAVTTDTDSRSSSAPTVPAVDAGVLPAQDDASIEEDPLDGSVASTDPGASSSTTSAQPSSDAVNDASATLSESTTQPSGDSSAALDGGPNTSAIAVAATDYSTCASTQGGLFCWGDNREGQLGVGDTEPHQGPVAALTAPDFVSLSGGRAHVCGLTSSAQVYCWGANDEGQLGVGDLDRRSAPTLVSDSLGQVTALSAGRRHTCAVNSERTLFCWGSNSDGQLGLDTSASALDTTRPLQVDDQHWLSVSCGERHTCGVKEDGSLWCWGRGTDGQVGSDRLDSYPQPYPIGSEVDWGKPFAGDHISCGLKRDSGSLWCWGDSGDIPLGNPPDAAPTEPQPLTDDGIADVHLGHSHACGQTTNDELYCLGSNDRGQLGNQNDALSDVSLYDEQSPVANNVTALALGRLHTCIIEKRSDGAMLVRCAGDNTCGLDYTCAQLGLDGVDFQNAFVTVPLPP